VDRELQVSPARDDYASGQESRKVIVCLIKVHGSARA
jgi:hypothetical protein